MLGRVEQVLVNAHHHVQGALLLDRRTDHHTLNALVQVGLQHRHSLHLTTGLDHQIATRPVGFGNRFVCGDLDAVTANHYMIAFGAGFVVPTAMHRVEVD
ncbi:hypothetical protein D3C80_1140810 [compost metagenome]